MNRKINFNSNEIFFGLKIPTVEDCLKLEATAETFIDNEKNYIINIQYDHDNNFLCMYFLYGSPLPYSNQTYDESRSLIVDTKREPTEAELNKQFFSFIDVSSSRLYLSSINKKALLVNYIKSKLDKDIDIRNIYKSYDEFYKVISCVKEIRLCSSYNLMTFKDSVFANKIDEFGLGSPNQYEIKCNFENVKKTTNFLNFLKRMVEKKQVCELDNLVCVGFDDNCMEKTFNLDTIMEKFEINIPDSKGMLDFAKIKDTVIEYLRSKNV